MPGFILHLTSAKMLLNQLPDHPHFPYMIASENDFMTGSLLPDATANKNRTHFPQSALCRQNDALAGPETFSFQLSESACK